MRLVVPPPVPPTVAVHGTTDRFPVRRVFCVARNYAAHAREMGADPAREPPAFFTKPADAVLDAGSERAARIPFPPETSNLHHEIELVVAIGTGGADIAVEQALAHVYGSAVGLDLTRRDLQNAAKDRGGPWDWGKAFDHSAPIAPIHPGPPPARGRIWLTVDGAARQDADLAEMIWSVPEIVAAVSRSMALAPGDLIFTGTPAGVGPIAAGQTVRGGIAGLTDLALTVGNSRSA